MLRRPKPEESDIDLEEQARQLIDDDNFIPATKTVRVNKRKSDEADKTEQFQNSLKVSPDASRPQSKFAQNRAKKAKEGLVDNTLIEEVLVRKDKVASCSLGRVIARDVPDVPPVKTFNNTSLSNPKPLVIKNTNDERVNDYLKQGIRKSLFKLQWEDDHLNESSVVNKQCDDAASNNNICHDQHLKQLGDESCILRSSEDAANIHSENLQKLSEMSHEERLAEQKQLLELLSPEHIEFLRNIRKNKSSAVIKAMDYTPSPDVAMDTASHSEQCSLTASASEEVLAKIVKFDDDVKVKEIPSTASDLDSLPINPREAQKWMHMDKVEMDKLKWMTNLPEIKPLRNNEGHTARFNFEGDLLPYDADIHWKQGLHHHGEEPERAGYTLDELFVLSRSQVIQQRHIGLRTIANILRNAKDGLYDQCFQSPILQLMVDAGVVLILRFSLDESSSLVYQEALRGLYYLVVSEGDERCLDLLDPWVPSGLQPGVSSHTYANDQSRAEMQEEEKDLKDIEVIKLDIIRALIRMDCHIRFRYILETLRPAPMCVIHILGIMTRIVRHSLTAAWTLASTPRLIEAVITHFLPCNVTSLITGVPLSQMSNVYGVPLWQAVRLFRIWASCGRQLANMLIDKGIMKQLSTYITIEPSDMKIPMQDSLVLSQEAYGLWKIFLRYGLTKSVEEFKSCQSVFIRQLLFYRDKVSVNENVSENKYNYDVGAYLIDTISQAFNVAATTSFLTTKMKQKQATVISDSKAVVIAPPEIEWDELNDLYELIVNCFKKWMTEATRVDKLSYSALRLMGSCCLFLTTFFNKWRDQKSFSGEQNLKRTQDLLNTLSNFSSSVVMSNLIRILPTHSALISNLKQGTLRDPQNLGSLGCITFTGKVTPIIKESSPFPFLAPFTQLLSTLVSLNPSFQFKFISQIIDSESFSHYINRVCESNSELSSQWVTRVEVHTLHNICLIASFIEIENKKMIHELALSIVSSVYNCDEHVIKSLLKQVICNTDFITNIDEMSNVIGSLDIKEWEPLKSPAIKQPTLSVTQLTQNMTTSLSSIGTIISNNLVMYKQYEQSNVLKSYIPFLTHSLTVDDADNCMVIDNYYPLYPFKKLMVVKREKLIANRGRESEEYESDTSPPEIILLARRCLQLTYFLIKFRRNAVLVRTNIMGWVRHLGLTFLAANDLFLDSEVNSYLQACLVELLRDNGYAKLDCNMRFFGLGSCYDWYKQLLEQFLAVSYGDLTFALFILLPAQQYWPSDYRKLLWGDLCDALPLIRITEHNLSNFVPVCQYLEPLEKDVEFIELYNQGFSVGVCQNRTPLLYKIAMHHIRFLSQNKGK